MVGKRMEGLNEGRLADGIEGQASQIREPNDARLLDSLQLPPHRESTYYSMTYEISE